MDASLMVGVPAAGVRAAMANAELAREVAEGQQQIAELRRDNAALQAALAAAAAEYVPPAEFMPPAFSRDAATAAVVAAVGDYALMHREAQRALAAQRAGRPAAPVPGESQRERHLKQRVAVQAAELLRLRQELDAAHHRR
jgi:hypothetical protein